MTRILHFADLHLDRSFAGLGMASSEAIKRRDELRAALRRIVDLALEMEADALTIGGDLYEHERATIDTGQFLRHQFERVNIPVLISPGNHDPYLPDSIYRQIEWSPNVHIFRDLNWDSVDLGDVIVYGVGHTAPDIRDNLLSQLRARDPKTTIALFHGSDMTAIPMNKTPHCPFYRRDLETCGADFVLLGHYHNRRLWPIESPQMGYPGSPEPLDFSEEGPHSVLFLETSEKRVSAQQLPFSDVIYRRGQIDVEGMTSSDQIREELMRLVGSQGKDIVRVELVGQSDPDLQIDLKSLLASAADQFRYLDLVDKTLLPYDIDELSHETTTRGSFVRKIQERVAAATTDEEVRMLHNSLNHGLRAFSNQEIRMR